MKKIVISINTSWNVFNFRIGLIKALMEDGFQVIALAPKDEYSSKLQEFGCQFIPLPMDRNGTRPIQDLILLLRYYLLLRKIKPDAYLGYTIKPNIYGSLASRLLNIPVINNIAGLGTTFINNGPITSIVKRLYKLSLAKSKCIFFQNNDDLELFVKLNLVDRLKTDRVPGSGINLKRYPDAISTDKFPFNFLFIGRILKDKGVIEYVEAAKIVLKTFPNTKFSILGFIDTDNANSISLNQIQQWENEGIIQYLGETDDVRPFIADSSCVVLPSYREGVPRSLLEAAAMSRPIIATNVAGCKDVVENGVNGYLCEPKNSRNLSERMIEMITLPKEKRAALGIAGRRKVENEFNETYVINKYLHALKTLRVK